MRDIIELSKRQPDLMAAQKEPSKLPEKVQYCLDSDSSKKLGAPTKENKVVQHALLVEGYATPSMAGLVQHRRELCGNASAEHFIKYGFFNELETVHFRILVNRDLVFTRFYNLPFLVSFVALARLTVAQKASRTVPVCIWTCY